MGKREFGLYSVFGEMTVIVLLVFTMRQFCSSNAAVGCSSMWAGFMGGEYDCGNLLWQSCRTIYSLF